MKNSKMLFLKLDWRKSTSKLENGWSIKKMKKQKNTISKTALKSIYKWVRERLVHSHDDERDDYNIPEYTWNAHLALG